MSLPEQTFENILQRAEPGESAEIKIFLSTVLPGPSLKSLSVLSPFLGVETVSQTVYGLSSYHPSRETLALAEVHK